MVRRTIDRLDALAVERASAPGRYPDGSGLYLRVADGGSKSWQLRFKLDGRTRYMGLGAYPLFSLAKARARAIEARRLKADGTDPIEDRRKERDERLAAARLLKAREHSFESCAEAYIASHKAGWRNTKHGDQWQATLATYAYPVFGALPVQSIDTGMIMKALAPIWATKSETATRVRGRIESVLGWATTSGYRTGDNPARWRGHLQNLLPARAKVTKVVHHPALPHHELGAFMAALRKQDGIAARALEFTILTAARTGEAIGVRWSEIDLDGQCWTVPGDRMKAGRDHRVALSAPVIALLRALQPVQQGDYIFAGAKSGAHLSNMAMLALLRRMKHTDITAHGFRSTFRDWTAESTDFPREVAEAALAHTLGDKVEAAYRRGDLFAKRQQLMEAWARTCATIAAPGVVLPFAAKA